MQPVQRPFHMPKSSASDAVSEANHQRGLDGESDGSPYPLEGGGGVHLILLAQQCAGHTVHR